MNLVSTGNNYYYELNTTDEKCRSNHESFRAAALPVVIGSSATDDEIVGWTIATTEGQYLDCQFFLKRFLKPIAFAFPPIRPICSMRLTPKITALSLKERLLSAGMTPKPFIPSRKNRSVAE